MQEPQKLLSWVVYQKDKEFYYHKYFITFVIAANTSGKPQHEG